MPYFDEIGNVYGATETAFEVFTEVLDRTYDIPPNEKPGYLNRMDLALMWEAVETLALLEPSGDAPLQAPGPDVRRTRKPRLSKRDKAMRRRRILGYTVALTSLLTASVTVTAAANLPSVPGALYGVGGFLLAGGGLLLAGWIEGGAT